MDSGLLIDGPLSTDATLVLAHGAGAPMDSPFMQAIAAGLGQRGIGVVRFEFPYMAKRRSSGKRAPPDRMPQLEARFREVAAGLSAARLFVGGKSLGGRVATHIADALGARGVVALGYPFHPPDQPQKLRVEHLTNLQTPCLIVQGTRDPLGTRKEVAGYPLAAGIRVHWLKDGDHSFEPRKTSGRSLEQNLAEAIAATAAFIEQTARGRVQPSTRGA